MKLSLCDLVLTRSGQVWVCTCWCLCVFLTKGLRAHMELIRERRERRVRPFDLKCPAGSGRFEMPLTVEDMIGFPEQEDPVV